IEKHLALVGVEVVWDVERATDVASELVVVNRSGDTGGERNGIARPGVGVERGVAQVFVHGPVKLARGGVRGDADLRAGAAAELGSVVRRKNLHFLRGVDVGRADAGAVGASARTGSAVKGDQVFRIARAIEVGGTLRKIEVQGGESAG